MPAKFAVTNDQSGDSKDATLEQFEELRLQGYRVVDAGGYDNAVAAAQEPQAAPAAAEPTSDYNAMTVDELKSELDSRGIDAPSGARKAELVSLLEDQGA